MPMNAKLNNKHIEHPNLKSTLSVWRVHLSWCLPLDLSTRCCVQDRTFPLPVLKACYDSQYILSAGLLKTTVEIVHLEVNQNKVLNLWFLTFSL